MGRKMKALESQMEKQQQDLSQGQRGSTWASACVWNTGVSQAEPKGVCTAFFPPTILKCFTDSNFYFFPKPRSLVAGASVIALPSRIQMQTLPNPQCSYCPPRPPHSHPPPPPPSVSPDHSSLLLHVKTFVSDLRSLSCQLAKLQGNGEEAGVPSPTFLPISAPGGASALDPPYAPLSLPGSENNCCPVNWVEHEGRCYWFSRTGKSWPEAEKYCQLENATLVVIGSLEEQVRALEGSSGSLAFLQRGHHPLLSPEICPAPHGPWEHLDRPHRPHWVLEMGGWFRL